MDFSNQQELSKYIPFIVATSVIGILTVIFIYNRVTSNDDEEDEAADN